MIWREKRILLIVLAVLLAANTLFFFTYRVQYENRLGELDTRLDQAKAQLDTARRARNAAAEQLASYRKTQKDIRDIYEIRWSTQQQRLTAMIAEVQRLGHAANLVPKAFAFTRTAPKTVSSVKTPMGTIEAGITFSVEGKYEQVRRLINLLELSEQFLIVDSISLSSVNGDNVNINVHVKTLFRDTPAPPRVPTQNL